MTVRSLTYEKLTVIVHYCPKNPFVMANPLCFAVAII
uniref:Uncharacterized protein n=1 Tax=Anguilla anguilla TaxID=7936 RepID=A0A0E9WL77_ANGAN